MHGESDLAAVVDEHVRAWTHGKGWRPLDVEAGEVDIAAGVVGSLVQLDDTDGSTSRRWRWTQTGSGGRWLTEVSTAAHPGNAGWVWVDVHGPAAATARSPRLVHTLLEVLPACDGAHRLTGTPVRVCGPDSVDEALAAILDPDRRGLMFVAGTSSQIPFDQWADYIGSLTLGTGAVAGTWILDADATEALNARLPEAYRVPAGAMRTYAPRVDVDSSTDPYRHRLLSTRRILQSSTGYLARVLASHAFIAAINSPLPEPVRRLDRRLRDRLDKLLTDTPAGPSPTRPAGGIVSTSGSSAGAVLAETCAVELGRPITAVDVDEIVALLRRGRHADRTTVQLAAARERLTQLQDGIDELAATNQLLQRRVDDEALEHAIAAEELAEERRRRRHLTAQLAGLERSELVDWDAGAATGLDVVPDTLEDLLTRLDEFAWVRWTGDDAIAADLDKHSHLTWAARTWEGLRTLESWGACRAGEISSPARTLREFVRQPPAGAVTAPPGRFTFAESTTTAADRRLKAVRTLPVPRAVDPAGAVFMAAHYVIGTDSSVSPRMHFLDDTTGTGKVYVGYIGPHLPNTRTN